MKKDKTTCQNDFNTSFLNTTFDGLPQCNPKHEKSGKKVFDGLPPERDQLSNYSVTNSFSESERASTRTSLKEFMSVNEEKLNILSSPKLTNNIEELILTKV